jgi:hypothetical protein
LELITSSVTDNASDAKKWAKTIAKFSSNEEEFGHFFCNLHKLGIGSRDCAVVVKAWLTRTTFATAKASQGRFDDFSADFYSTYSKLHRLLPMDEVDADTVKATPIRFLTFDRNVCVTFPVYEQIVHKIEEKKQQLNKINEQLDEAQEEIVKKMKQQTYRFAAWGLSVLYAKFHYPYLKRMKASESNISFNQELVNVIFPRLKDAATRVNEFFEGAYEIFEGRPTKAKYANKPRPSTDEIDVAKFNLDSFLVSLLTELFKALERNSSEFCAGGKYSELTEAQKAVFAHIPTTTISVEASFGRWGHNNKLMPNATVNYNSAREKLTRGKFSMDLAQKLVDEIGEVHVTNFFKMLDLQESEKQQNKANNKIQQQEAEQHAKELLKKAAEKEDKANEKEKQKEAAQWIEKEKLDELAATNLKIQCRKHSLPVSGTKQALLDRLLLHIRCWLLVLEFVYSLARKDNTCLCVRDQRTAKTVDAYIGQIALFIVDFEGTS